MRSLSLFVLFALAALAAGQKDKDTCCNVDKILSTVESVISAHAIGGKKDTADLADQVIRSVTKHLSRAYDTVSDSQCVQQIQQANEKTVKEANHMLCLLRSEIKHMKSDAADFRSKAFRKILQLQTTIHTQITRRHMAEYRYRSAMRSYKSAKSISVAQRKAAIKARYLAAQVVAFARRETRRRQFAERSERRSRRSAKLARLSALRYKRYAYRSRRAARRARYMANIYRRKYRRARYQRTASVHRYSRKLNSFDRRYKSFRTRRIRSLRRRRCTVFHKYIYHAGLRQMISLHRDQRNRRMWMRHAWLMIHHIKRQARVARRSRHRTLLMRWHKKLLAMHHEYSRTYFHWNKACLMPFKAVAKASTPAQKTTTLSASFLNL